MKLAFTELEPILESLKGQGALLALNTARSAHRASYSPYSRFKVGVGLSCHAPDRETVLVVPGTNVENASYGLTCCAERCAIFTMLSLGASKPEVLVIYTPTPEPVAPCGACRQVIVEHAQAQTKVVSVCDGPSAIYLAALDLLPDAFSSLDLSAKK